MHHPNLGTALVGLLLLTTGSAPANAREREPMSDSSWTADEVRALFSDDEELPPHPESHPARQGVIANGGGVPVPAEGIGRGCTVPPAAAE